MLDGLYTQSHSQFIDEVCGQSVQIELHSLAYRVQQITFLQQLATDPIRMIPGSVTFSIAE